MCHRHSLSHRHQLFNVTVDDTITVTETFTSSYHSSQYLNSCIGMLQSARGWFGGVIVTQYKSNCGADDATPYFIVGKHYVSRGHICTPFSHFLPIYIRKKVNLFYVPLSI